MKFHLLILAAPLLFVSCASTGEDSVKEEVITPKEVTAKPPRKTTTATPEHLPRLPKPSPSVGSSKKDDYEKFEPRVSEYGSLRNADAPPTRSELESQPAPIELPNKNIITPPTAE